MPTDQAPDFSVVIAALNEADNIGAVIDEIREVFGPVLSFEIVVVDDGSTDGTAEVVTGRQTPGGSDLVLVRHGRRRGKSAGLGTGIWAARGRWIVTMDADGQDDPKEALKLAQALRAAPEPQPLVAGIRRRRLDGVWRLAATRFANGLRQAVLNDDCVDTGCGLKAFPRALFLKFPMFEGLHRFLPAMAKAQGHPILSIPIEQRARMSGESKYTNLGRAAVGIFDLMGAAWLARRARPEHPFPRPEADRNKLSMGAYLALTLFAALMFGPGQSSLPPFDRDESRYAQATTQMLETGDLIDIHYQDQVRYLQPAGIYWLQAAAVTAFGDVKGHEISAHRLPSYLSAIIAVLLTGWIGARAFGSAAGVLAAVAMGSCLLLGVEARMAKIDATLLAVTLGAQAILLRAYLDRTRLSWRAAALFWALLGAGLMLKGPLIVLFVGLTALSLSLWDRSTAWLLRLRPVLFVLTMAVVAPWIWAISVKTHGGFLSEALGHSLLGKVGGGQQRHGGAPGYHLMMFGLMFWPSAVFAVLAIPFAWAKRRDPAVRFMIAWIVPAWIVFEAVATKLPHYVLPLYPALACLAAAAVLDGRKAWSVGGRIGIAFAAILVALEGLILIGALGYVAFDYRSSILGLAIAVCGIAGVLWLWVCWRLARGRRDVLAMLVGAAAGVVLLPITFGSVAPSLQRLWLSRGVAQTFARVRPCPTTQLVSAPYAEPSMVFLVGTGTDLTDGPGAARRLLADGRCGLALLAGAEEPRFLTAMSAAGRQPVVVGEVDGRNYSDGQDLKLKFYRLPTP